MKKRAPSSKIKVTTQ